MRLRVQRPTAITMTALMAFATANLDPGYKETAGSMTPPRHFGDHSILRRYRFKFSPSDSNWCATCTSYCTYISVAFRHLSVDHAPSGTNCIPRRGFK